MKQLDLDLEGGGHNVINVGYCTLHIANNAVKSMLTVLRPITDICTFLKCSAACGKNGTIVGAITEITEETC